MPHQCTTCGNVFPDGSKEMLSGCPDCGGNAFQFYRREADVPAEPPDAEPPSEDPGVAGTVGRAASTVRDLVGGDAADRPPGEGATAAETPEPDAPWPDDADEEPDDADDADIIVADETPAGEDAAQASARTDLAAPDEVDGATPDAEEGTGGPLAATDADGLAAPDADDGRVVSEPTGERPDISELRDQLNDQFESIKIVEPGQYELNLMELYDREEYIIALQENGRYVIQVPEDWLGDRPGEA